MEYSEAILVVIREEVTYLCIKFVDIRTVCCFRISSSKLTVPGRAAVTLSWERHVRELRNGTRWIAARIFEAFKDKARMVSLIFQVKS